MLTNVLLTLLFITLLYLLHKARRIHVTQFSQQELLKTLLDDHYAQIQSYVDLQSLLGLQTTMPRLRGWAASPDFLLFAARHTLREKPKVIVECSSGASTLVLARCCQLNGIGHVFSLEHDPIYADITRSLLEGAGLSEFVTVVDAPIEDVVIEPTKRWYSVSGLFHILEKPIDLLVVDGPPMETGELARYPAIPLFWKKLAPSFSVIMDDANRLSEKNIVLRWIADHPELHVKNLQLEKGGVLIARETAS